MCSSSSSFALAPVPADPPAEVDNGLHKYELCQQLRAVALVDDSIRNLQKFADAWGNDRLAPPRVAPVLFARNGWPLSRQCRRWAEENNVRHVETWMELVQALTL